MPFQLLNTDGVAEYLHLTVTDVEQRVKNREIPFERRGNRIVFRKRQIEEWASSRIMNLPEPKLAVYHAKSTRQAYKMLKSEALLPKMMGAGAVAAEMKSKTKASVLSDLVALAESTGNVYQPHDLLEAIKSREALCSTGMPGGFALPHPRFYESYLLGNSFIVAGRTVQEIHFGAHDGEPTRLFFLLCCQDERLHLHALARLCVILKRAEVIDRLLGMPDAKAMQEFLMATEEEVLNEGKTDSKPAS